MPVPQVAVYCDEGAGEFSRGALLFALARHFEGAARVRRVYADELSASDAWHASTLLLAFPGGADRPYCAKLNGAGNASILRYLQDGGAVLGVCAGAYYTSARIAFEPGGITGARELALFQGTARGSLNELAEPYSLDHLRCSAVVPLRSADGTRTLQALYWGGPEFVPDAGAVYTPLMSYVMPSGRSALAAVLTRVGKGRAVLTGVHAEVLGAQFPIEVSRYGSDSFEHGMQIAERLVRAEGERAEAFRLQLGALGF